MACNRARRVVFLWVDRGNETLPVSLLERHFDDCPECREHAVRVERVVLLLRSCCRRAAPPAALAARIRGLFDRN